MEKLVLLEEEIESLTDNEFFEMYDKIGQELRRNLFQSLLLLFSSYFLSIIKSIYHKKYH